MCVGRYELSLRICTGRGFTATLALIVVARCLHMYCTGIAGVFAQIFAGVYMHCYALLSKYVPVTWIFAHVLHRFLTDPALMMHRQVAHFNCNHHSTGKGTGGYVRSLQGNFSSDWHRHCTDIAQLLAHTLHRYCIWSAQISKLFALYKLLGFLQWILGPENLHQCLTSKFLYTIWRTNWANIVDGVSYKY